MKDFDKWNKIKKTTEKEGSSGKKGLITIKTYADASNVFIELTDSGCGIAPENIAKVFDPFFTTKDVGQGTGQGLSIAYQVVVDQHGGRINVKSEQGVETTFTISLPL